MKSLLLSVLLFVVPAFGQAPKDGTPVFEAQALANQAGKNVDRFVEDWYLLGHAPKRMRLHGKVYSIRPDKAATLCVEGCSYIIFQTQSSLNDHTAIAVILKNREAKKLSVGDDADLLVQFNGEDTDHSVPSMATHVLVFIQYGGLF